MNKRDRIRLDDIEQVVEKILARSVGLSEVEFNQNEDLQVVLTHFVQIWHEKSDCSRLCERGSGNTLVRRHKKRSRT